MMSVPFLCETAEKAFASNDFSEKMLSGYQKRWYPEVGKELGRSYRLRRIYLKFNNDDMNRIYPNMANRKVNEALNTVDIDKPTVSASLALRNIPTVLKLASTVIRAKVRR